MADVEAKFDAHVRRYRDQVENLKKSLKKRGLIRNPERLESLFRKPPELRVSTCPIESQEETYEWTYEIKDIALTLSGLRHPQPPGAVFGSGNGLLSCKITEYFVPNRRGGVAVIIPIKSMELGFIVDGNLRDASGDHPLLACWHIDTHSDAEPGSTGGQGEEIEAEVGGEVERDDNHALHPLFHYQFGGRKLRPSGPLVRGVLMLDVPRIPVPPLDLNLAIDFIVTNYLGANWKHLRRDTQYAHPVRDSMRRIWGPYYAALSGHFSGGHAERRLAAKLLPDLL